MANVAIMLCITIWALYLIFKKQSGDYATFIKPGGTIISLF